MRALFNNKKFLLLLLLVYLLDPVALFMLHAGISLPDFRSYYAAAALLGNGSLYNPELIIQAGSSLGENRSIYPYLYPPLLAYLIEPLTIFSPIVASFFFLFANYLLLFAVVISCYRAILKPYFNAQNTPWLLAAVLFLLPLHSNLQMGQINILVLAAIVIAFIGAKSWPLLSGMAFNLAVLIKMTPIGFVGLLLAQQRFSLLAKWLLSGCAVLVVMVILDTGNWLEFFSFFKQALLNPPEALSEGVELYGFSLRMTLQRLGVMDEFVPLLRALCFLLAVILLLPISFYLRDSEKSLWLLYLPFSIVMVLASPISYTHHVIYLLPGALAWAYYFYQLPQRMPLVSFLILLMLAGIDFPLWFSANEQLPELLRSMNFFALAGLFLLSTFYLWRHKHVLSH